VRRLPLLVLLLLAGASAAGAVCPPRRCPDPTAVEAARTRVALACDCAAADSHRAWVRCTRGVLAAAIRDGTLARRCKKAVAACEARATCGRDAAVVCCSPARNGKVRGRVVRDAARCGGDGATACGTASHAADACAEDASCRPPNVVVILADDLGYADVGPFGATTIATPHLDRLAAEGMRLADFYAAASCTPARAALMTGSYGERVSVPFAYFPGQRAGLHPDEVTVAEVLRSRGYATGMFGKWHLGDQPAFLPTRQGFDEYLGIPYSNDMSPLHPLGPDLFPALPLFDGEEVVELDPDQSQLTRRLTARAIDFIGRHAGEPFFVYLAHPMPHVPIFASAAFRGRSAAGLYGDVVEELDWSVGEVLAALDAHGIARRTLVLFASDNGPWLVMGEHAGSALPLREGKGTTFEGGVRVPAIARWLGRIPAGTTSAEAMGLIDVLPTVAGLAGAPLPERVLDGRDVWPLLAGTPGAPSPHEVLYFYRDRGLEAVRRGRWKLHLPHAYDFVRVPGRNGKFGALGQGHIETALFDVVADPGETTDVAAAHPEVVAELLALVERGRSELGDRLTDRTGSATRPQGRVP